MIPNLQAGSRFNFGNFANPGVGSTAMPARPIMSAPVARQPRPVMAAPTAPIARPIAQPVSPNGAMPFRGTAMPASPTFNPTQFLNGGMAGPYQPLGSAPTRRPMLPTNRGF